MKRYVTRFNESCLISTDCFVHTNYIVTVRNIYLVEENQNPKTIYVFYGQNTTYLDQTGFVYLSKYAICKTALGQHPWIRNVINV